MQDLCLSRHHVYVNVDEILELHLCLFQLVSNDTFVHYPVELILSVAPVVSSMLALGWMISPLFAAMFSCKNELSYNCCWRTSPHIYIHIIYIHVQFQQLQDIVAFFVA